MIHSTHSEEIGGGAVWLGLLLPTLLSSSDGVRLAPHPLVEDEESVDAVDTVNLYKKLFF